MIDRTKNFVWTRAHKKPTRCAKNSYRTVKSGRVLVRLCCPPGQVSKKGRCKVAMRTVSLGYRRGFGEATVKVSRAHLREDMREAKAMIRELQRGVRRDQKALKRSR